MRGEGVLADISWEKQRQRRDKSWLEIRGGSSFFISFNPAEWSQVKAASSLSEWAKLTERLGEERLQERVDE